MPVTATASGMVHWTRAGQGAPALLLHCSLAHAGAWSGMMRALADRLDMLAPDLPAHGRSDPVPEGGDFQTVATERARALAERVFGPAPVIAIGHSFGATVAMRMALETPERVRALVLFEPVYFGFIHDAGGRLEDWLPPTEAEVDRLIAAGRLEEAARRFTESWGTGAPWEALPAEQRRYMAERMPAIAAGRPAIIDPGPQRFHLRDFAALGQPVLLLEGERSPPVVGEVQRLLAATLPDAERERIPGAGHMAPVTHPEAVAARVRAFLDRRGL